MVLAKKPVAFLSYAHLDDGGVRKEISSFHEKLQGELRVHTGFPGQIFFDNKSISWGERWGEVIERGLEGAAFLIPILTPGFFQSKYCRDEYEKFVKVEEKLGRRDLILPIYYVKSREMEAETNEDSIIKNIRSRHYKDWRAFRHQSLESMEVRREFSDLASAMAETYFEILDAANLDDDSKKKFIERNSQAIDYSEELLNREISYDNLIAYSVMLNSKLPISPTRTRDLLEEINKDRYKTIRDLDNEVKYAKSKVTEYAEKRPGRFRYAIDYVIKSLSFVDSEFRNIHKMSSETLATATKAGVTRY